MASKKTTGTIHHENNHRHTNLRLGVFGFGCVGQGLYHVLHETKGVKAEIKKICVKHKNKQRSLPEDIFTYDKEEILTDPDIDVVIELIDDSNAAFEIVKTALQNGKAVVTANTSDFKLPTSCLFSLALPLAPSRPRCCFSPSKVESTARWTCGHKRVVERSLRRKWCSSRSMTIRCGESSRRSRPTMLDSSAWREKSGGWSRAGKSSCTGWVTVRNRPLIRRWQCPIRRGSDMTERQYRTVGATRGFEGLTQQHAALGSAH